MEDKSRPLSHSGTPDPKANIPRPLYSSKLGNQKRAPDAANPPRQPAVQQKAWTSGARNPITGRAHTPQVNFASTNKTSSLREGQRVRVTLTNGSEHEGIYESNHADLSSFVLKMVPPKKSGGSDLTNGLGKTMSFTRKDVSDARVLIGNNAKAPDGKAVNGRTAFRTDNAISNSGPATEPTLKRWVPDTQDPLDGGLESSGSIGCWDQFKEHDKRFGTQTTYHENLYTTEIDRSHPDYKRRAAYADRLVGEINSSTPVTSHVAEERIMDNVGGDDDNEEAKYSGVAREVEYPPLSSRENKYMPPAKRAPTGQATVKGAPFDPAIISSQIKGAPQNPSPKVEPGGVKIPNTPVTDGKATSGKNEVKAAPKASGENAADAKTGDKNAASLRPAAAATGRTVSVQAKEAAAPPGATSTVERELLNSFKNFASQQRMTAEKLRSSRLRHDKEVRLTELKKFANTFKLSTPVPKDLISIIAKDPAKQKAIQAKALQNAEEMSAKKKSAEIATKSKEAAPKKEPASQSSEVAIPASGTNAATDTRATTTAPKLSGPQGANLGLQNRHAGARASYGPQGNYQFSRQTRGPHNVAHNNHGTMGLSTRLRAIETQKMQEQHKMQHQQHMAMGQHMAGSQDLRMAPTGPANPEGPYGRRLSGNPQGHVGQRLNPATNEFRPNAFAMPFNPGHSQASSPRSMATPAFVPEPPPAATAAPPPQPGQLIRRKTKAIDTKKCFILSHLETIEAPSGKKWDDNDKLQPSFDTPPTWRQLQNQLVEPSESTMNMTYMQYFDKFVFTAAAMATPTPPLIVPLPHQYQLPIHLQGPRQSPAMAPLAMHGQHHGPAPHVPFSGPDDHRMMPSSSAQSFSSPRMNQLNMAYPPPVNSPGQPPFSHPAMPQYGGGAPMMYNRSFSNNPQFMPNQLPHMAGPMMMQPGFMPGPNGMVSTGPGIMYPPNGQHHQFMSAGAGPPQAMATNGFPSPGRVAAPVMAHQGSQQGSHHVSHQGQPGYGMSPAIPYQQPYALQQGQGREPRQ